MKRVLHIIGGDVAGESLKKSGVPGEVFVWHDILYDGPREPGWPGEETITGRALFLEGVTGGGLGRQEIVATLTAQYRKLETAGKYDGLVLWFDACLFDQAMLAHILACLTFKGIERAELICVDAFPGVVPYHGLGQLSPGQLASVYDQRRPVTKEQFRFAEEVDRAFALQDHAAFVQLSRRGDATLPWVPAAVARWLEEVPDATTGLGRLEQLALDALRSGCTTPNEIFAHVAAHDTPPQYWGDITLWAKINGLATRTPPPVRIQGPAPLLPQWNCKGKMEAFGVVLPEESRPWRDVVAEQFPGESIPASCLRGARGREGLTQRQLADVTGIPQRHISEMEHGKRPIGKENARKLAKALNTDYRVFL